MKKPNTLSRQRLTKAKGDASGDAQHHEADAALSLNLLNAGTRILKGKLRQVDPRRVRRSRIANRAIEDENSVDYQRLLELHRQSGTNTVPALAHEAEVSATPREHDYELVYGHRRHQVCLAEGLPFTVIVVPLLDDVERTFLMANENEGRVSPCPLDLGLWLAALLDGGHFASQAAVARTTGIKPASVTNLLKLARLPSEVVDAFNDRSELAHRHALPLGQAANEDLDGLVERAKEIVALRTTTGGKIDKQRVLSMLLGAISIDAAALSTEPLRSPTSVVDAAEAVKTTEAVDEPSLEFPDVSVKEAAEALLPDEAITTAAPATRGVKRFNKTLPLITDQGDEPGQVFIDEEGDTFIRLPFTLNDVDLDWFAVNVGQLLTNAPFLHKVRRDAERGEGPAND